MAWSKRSRQQRGYDERYLAARQAALRRDGYLCQCDQCKGGLLRLRVAHETHHIVPLADFMSGKATGDPHALSNLLSINRECHKRIGLEERGIKPKPRYDRNGRRIEAGGAMQRPPSTLANRSLNRARVHISKST